MCTVCDYVCVCEYVHVRMPVCVCVFFLQFVFYTCAAASSMNTCMTLSSWATTSIEEVAQANGGGLRWFQLYVYRDKTITMDLIRRAEHVGYKALVITVDTPILGRRLADSRNKFKLPDHLKLANFSTQSAQSSVGTQQQSESGLYRYTQALIDPKLTWDTIKWVKSLTTLPVIVKGILTGEDAKLAVQHGVDGIIVSNHGARQLDGVYATVSVIVYLATVFFKSVFEAKP